MIKCLIVGLLFVLSGAFPDFQFPGSPIKIGRARLASGSPIQAIVVNNKISNVCAGGDGEANAELVCEAVAAALNLEGGVQSVLPSSTGVIGWRLPAKELAEEVVPKAVEALQTDTAFTAARDIMTTDRYAKLRSKTLSNGARIVGIAKASDDRTEDSILIHVFGDSLAETDLKIIINSTCCKIILGCRHG